MRSLNPEYVTAVCAMASASPYFQLLSMKLVRFEIGACHVEIPVQAKHLQPFGIVHGGVFSSIIDAAAFWAVFPEIDEDKGLTSVDLKLNYLAPAAAGVLVARGKRIKAGRTLALAEATVSDENGKILAYGTSTLMILPSANLQAGAQPLPSKFLI